MHPNPFGHLWLAPVSNCNLLLQCSYPGSIKEALQGQWKRGHRASDFKKDIYVGSKNSPYWSIKEKIKGTKKFKPIHSYCLRSCAGKGLLLSRAYRSDCIIICYQIISLCVSDSQKNEYLGASLIAYLCKEANIPSLQAIQGVRRLQGLACLHCHINCCSNKKDLSNSGVLDNGTKCSCSVSLTNACLQAWDTWEQRWHVAVSEQSREKLARPVQAHHSAKALIGQTSWHYHGEQQGIFRVIWALLISTRAILSHHREVLMGPANIGLPIPTSTSHKQSCLAACPSRRPTADLDQCPKQKLHLTRFRVLRPAPGYSCSALSRQLTANQH